MPKIFRTDEYVRDAVCWICGHVLRQRVVRLNPSDGFMGFSAVDIDKTIRLIDKLWEAHVTPVAKTRGSRMVNFPVRKDLNDVHGQRTGFVIKYGANDAKYVPVLDVMLSLDAACKTAKVLMAHELTEPWGVLTLWEPQVSSADLIRFVEEGLINPKDVKFFELLGLHLGCLDSDEIIALGRHETPEGTEESIVFELSLWVGRVDRMLRRLANGGESNLRKIPRDLWRALSFGLECIKKSGVDDAPHISDRTFYTTGLARLYNDNVTPDMRIALDAAQRPAGEIWDDTRVATLRVPSYAAWVLSLYLAGALSGAPDLPANEVELHFKAVRDTRDDIARLLAVDASSVPRDFSRRWLERLSPVAIALPTSSDVESGLPLPEVAEIVRPVFEDFLSSMFEPRIALLRSQPT